MRSDACNTFRAASEHIVPEVKADGTFSAVDVPPGDYTLQINVGDDAKDFMRAPAGTAVKKFNVPPGDDETVVDIGEITVRPWPLAAPPK